MEGSCKFLSNVRGRERVEANGVDVNKYSMIHALIGIKILKHFSKYEKLFTFSFCSFED